MTAHNAYCLIAFLSGCALMIIGAIDLGRTIRRGRQRGSAITTIIVGILSLIAGLFLKERAMPSAFAAPDSRAKIELRIKHPIPGWIFEVEETLVNPQQTGRDAHGGAVLVFVKRTEGYYHFKSPIPPYDLKVKDTDVARVTHQVVKPEEESYNIFLRLFVQFLAHNTKE